jgi:hypothetical protein
MRLELQGYRYGSHAQISDALSKKNTESAASHNAPSDEKVTVHNTSSDEKIADAAVQDACIVTISPQGLEQLEKKTKSLAAGNMSSSID